MFCHCPIKYNDLFLAQMMDVMSWVGSVQCNLWFNSCEDCKTCILEHNLCCFYLQCRSHYDKIGTFISLGGKRMPLLLLVPTDFWIFVNDGRVSTVVNESKCSWNIWKNIYRNFGRQYSVEHGVVHQWFISGIWMRHFLHKTSILIKEIMQFDQQMTYKYNNWYHEETKIMFLYELSKNMGNNIICYI